MLVLVCAAVGILIRQVVRPVHEQATRAGKDITLSPAPPVGPFGVSESGRFAVADEVHLSLLEYRDVSQGLGELGDVLGR